MNVSPSDICCARVSVMFTPLTCIRKAPRAHLPESGEEGGLRWIPRNHDSFVKSNFCAVMSPTKGITALYTVSQIGSRIPRRSPAVQVVLFQFFLFKGGARLLLPRGPPAPCTGSRRLNTIEKKPNSGPVKSRTIVNKGTCTLRTNNFYRIHRRRLECHVHAKSAEGIIDPLLVVLTRSTEIAWKK